MVPNTKKYRIFSERNLIQSFKRKIYNIAHRERRTYSQNKTERKRVSLVVPISYVLILLSFFLTFCFNIQRSQYSVYFNQSRN